MGFFDLFRKKKQADPAPSALKEQLPSRELPEAPAPAAQTAVPEEGPAEGTSEPLEERISESLPLEESLEEISDEGLDEISDASMDDSWDASLDESVSLSLSKGSVAEDILPPQPPGQKPGFGDSAPDSISNEEITEGDQLLETYRVVSKAIKGGMGSVWKVHHNGWNRELAMKRPQPKYFAEGSEARKETFIKECEAWIDLGLHPNIVSCYYVREIGGVPTIFSEWMENGSLKNRIEDRSLYEVRDDGGPAELQERLLDIAIQFARGLHYAHESKDHLIHQDVKPDNLLLTKDWEAKVADFGLAHARKQLQETPSEGQEQTGFQPDSQPDSEGATHLAPTGGYTPAYCSAEQFLGEKLTRRTDIYSWAVSVLEMYLGERPWKKGMEAGSRCRSYLEKCKVPMPGSLQALLIRCLAGNPKDRPHDFGVIGEALENIYRETCGVEYPRPMPEAAADNADSLNNRALSYLDLGREGEAEKLWAQSLEAMPDHLVTIYNQGIYQWRKAQIDDEELLRRMASVRQGSEKELFTRLVSQVSGERGVSEEKLFEESSLARRIKGGSMERVALSPDGSRLFTASAKIGGNVRSFDTRTLECKYDVRKSVSQIAYSAPGNRLLATHEETLEIINADSEQSVSRGKSYTGSGIITDLRLSPDRRYCYTLHVHYGTLDAKPVIRKINLESGTCEKEYNPADNSPISSFEPSRDGKKLFISLGHKLRTVDVRSGGWSDYSVRGFSPLIKEKFCVSGDEKCFYATGYSGLNVWHAGNKEKDYHGTTDVTHLILSPDEKLLLTGGKDLKIWDTSNMRCLRTLFCGGNAVSSLAASEDFSVIVTGGKTIRVWDHAADPETSPAPWELTVSKSYKETKEEQEQTEGLASEMAGAIEKEDWQRAFSLLLSGEAEYGTAGSEVFRSFRRTLTARMKRAEIVETYENGIIENGTSGYNNNFAVCPATGRVAMAARKPVSKISFRSVVKILDEDLKFLREIALPFSPDAVAVSPSGELLAVGMDDTVSVYRLDDGGNDTVLKEFTPAENLSNSFLRFSPDSRRLLIRNWAWVDGKMKSALSLWDMETMEPAEKLRCFAKEEKFEREVFDAQFTPDGRNIVSGECLASRQGESETLRNRLCVYDPGTGEKILQMKQKKYDYYGTQQDFMTFRKVMFSENGEQIIAGQRSYYSTNPANANTPTASVWDKNTGELLEETGPSKMEIMCQSPDRKLFAAAAGKDIVIGSCKDWKEMARFSLPSDAKNIRGIAFAPSMSTVYVSYDNELLARELVWRLES